MAGGGVTAIVLDQAPAPDWEQTRWWQGHLKAQGRILEELADEPLFRVIDIGCGSGQFCLAVALAHPEAAVLGVEPVAARVTEARANVAALPGRDLRIVAGDAGSLPAADGSMDAAVMVAVLHWLAPRQREALREVRRVLRPGGQFLLANMLRRRGVRQFTIAVDAFVRDTAATLGIQLLLPPDDFHRRHWTLERLCALLESEGLRTERVRTWVSRRRYASGAEFVGQLDRAMNAYYWAGLPEDAARALQDGLIRHFDLDTRLAARGFPIVNGIIRARRTER
jgi:ubiquinone/menaquinone biosynthesis C-methylase UbiE